MATWMEKFGQLSFAHIHELAFPGLTRKPCDRALTRLTNSQYLKRLEHRTVGGARGGSGQYVYQLSSKGLVLFHGGGKYKPPRRVNYHSLAIADCYLHLLRLERAGQLRIVGMSNEPHCWVTVAGQELHPDMYVELERPGGDRLHLWFEVDMGSEGQTKIKEKLERYWRAFNEADSSVVPIFPRIVFAAVDQERVDELKWLIGQGPDEAQPLFRVMRIDEIPTCF